MSCFGGKDEQIYLVELTIERLKLTADKYREDFSICPPLIKVKFLDFPVFIICPRICNCTDSSASIKPPPEYDEKEGLIYACGKSMLFVMKPRDLITAMQIEPLRIGIFRADETFPIAEGTAPLSGCLCDQVAMTGNDKDHRPKPYELAGNFTICDPGKNHAGSIKIYFRLTFFGTYIISHYQLYEDSCIFKNDYDGELRVMKVNDDCEDEKFNITEGTVLAAIRSERVSEDKK